MTSSFRPRNLIDQRTRNNIFGNPLEGNVEPLTFPTSPVAKLANGRPSYLNYGGRSLKITDGRVEDPVLLDTITRYADSFRIVLFSANYGCLLSQRYSRLLGLFCDGCFSRRFFQCSGGFRGEGGCSITHKKFWWVGDELHPLLWCFSV